MILVVALMTLHRVEVGLENPFLLTQSDDLRFDVAWDLFVFDQMRPFPCDTSGDSGDAADGVVIEIPDAVPSINLNRGRMMDLSKAAKKAKVKTSKGLLLLASASRAGTGFGRAQSGAAAVSSLGNAEATLAKYGLKPKGAGPAAISTVGVAGPSQPRAQSRSTSPAPSRDPPV